MRSYRQSYSSIIKKDVTRYRSLVYILLVTMALFATSGCSKWLAGISLNKAKKLLLEAEKREAPRLEPQEYEDTKKQIEEAERLINEKNYKGARERAGRAVEKAENVLENSRKKLAAQRLNEAKEALDVADRNNGVQIDQERYNKIKELYNKAQEKQQRNKWDDVIQLCDQEMAEVDTLLARLLNQARQKQTTAQTKFQEMKAAGAEEYAPEYVIAVKDMLRTIEKNIDEDRDYVGARNLADEAIRKCEKGITATKGKMAQEQISKIEDGLSDAVNKGAQIYAKDLLKNCNEAFDNIIEQYYAKKYDKVLDSAEFLAPKVEKLIYTTRLKSAEAKIKTVEKEIDTLEEGGARQYLPGRVEKIEEYLREARQKFNQQQFEEAENECMVALREAEKTHSAFNDLALDAMRNGAESLDIARNVFDKMSEVFIIRPDLSSLSEINQQFEQNKNAMKSELDSILKNARLTLGIAKLRQEEGKYRKAIELAGEVKQSSEYVLNETYHVVAHNAIMELSEQITMRETDGAREYAPVELDRTRNLLDRAKELLEAGDYKESVRKAAETRAQLELTTQELAQKAVENMDKAKKQIASAPQYRTLQYKKEELQRAQSLLDEAEQALKNQNLKPAVEIALEAAKVAKEASDEAARLWCEQILEEAKASIAKAEEAGALTYAAEWIDEAKRFYSTANNLCESGNYMEGKDAALRAVQKAKDSLYKNVITAESAINEAKSYKGWEYRYSLLSQAIVDAKLARQAIEEGDYISSFSYAEKATLEARKVVRDSKKVAFHERVDDISQGMDQAMHSGANYFQSGEAKKIYRQLADVQEDFNVDNFDFIDTQMDKLHADLERLINATPEVLNQIIIRQRERLDAQNKTKAVDFASELLEEAGNNLRYARIDYDKGKYSQSYRDLRVAIKNLDEVEERLAMESYAMKAGNILEELNDALVKFRYVLDLGPKMLQRFTRGPTGEGQYISISGKMKPDKFRTVVTELFHKARQLEVPGRAEGVHKDLLDMLNDVRVSSIYFEKLIILDEFEAGSRRDIINRAFELIDLADQKRSKLQESFLNRDKKMRLANIP